MIDQTDGGRRKTWMLSIRSYPGLRERLESAAFQTGRSVTQEVESRLERTFAGDDFVGGAITGAFLNSVGAAIAEIEARTGKAWHSDEEVWSAVAAMVESKMKDWSPSSPRPSSGRKTKTIYVPKGTNEGRGGA